MSRYIVLIDIDWVQIGKAEQKTCLSCCEGQWQPTSGNICTVDNVNLIKPKSLNSWGFLLTVFNICSYVIPPVFFFKQLFKMSGSQHGHNYRGTVFYSSTEQSR